MNITHIIAVVYCNFCCCCCCCGCNSESQKIYVMSQSYTSTIEVFRCRTTGTFHGHISRAHFLLFTFQIYTLYMADNSKCYKYESPNFFWNINGNKMKMTANSMEMMVMMKIKMLMMMAKAMMMKCDVMWCARTIIIKGIKKCMRMYFAAHSFSVSSACLCLVIANIEIALFSPSLSLSPAVILLFHLILSLLLSFSLLCLYLL